MSLPLPRQAAMFLAVRRTLDTCEVPVSALGNSARNVNAFTEPARDASVKELSRPLNAKSAASVARAFFRICVDPNKAGFFDAYQKATSEQVAKFRSTLVAALKPFAAEYGYHGPVAVDSEEQLVNLFHLTCGFIGSEEFTRRAHVVKLPGLGEIPAALMCRNGIESESSFCGRKHEFSELSSLVSPTASHFVQISGKHHPGRTALLDKLVFHLGSCGTPFKIAVAKMSDTRLQRQAGLLKYVARCWDLNRDPRDLPEFYALVDEVKDDHCRRVLIFDDADEFAMLHREFDAMFFHTLRAAENLGISIIASVQSSLAKVCPPQLKKQSPVYARFIDINLGPMTEAEVAEFLDLTRFHVEPFASREFELITDFAHGYPSLLQVARLEMLRARQKGKSPASAIEAALRGASANDPRLFCQVQQLRKKRKGAT